MNNFNQIFSRELLEQPIEDRIQYFDDYTVAHPKLTKAFKEFQDNMAIAKPGSIMLIYGPTGVGKSTLYKKILNHYREMYEHAMKEDKGFIPIVGEEAAAPEDGKFDWKDFYTRSLSQLNEPLIEQKVELDSFKKGFYPKERTKAAYRRALENALTYRKPRVFLIDEAQHITRIGRGKKLSEQMDLLKSLASKTNLPIVLIGTYEVLKFRNLSGQLIRRGLDVHIERYQAEIIEDREAFQNVLWIFQKCLPVPKEPNLMDYWDYFYLRTIGCIGLLKEWLYRTLKCSLMNDPNIQTLHIEDFKKFEFSLTQIEKLSDEATEREKLMEEDPSKEPTLRAKLGLVVNHLESTSEEPENSSKKNSKRNNRKKVGERNPVRDKVGLEHIEPVCN